MRITLIGGACAVALAATVGLSGCAASGAPGAAASASGSPAAEQASDLPLTAPSTPSSGSGDGSVDPADPVDPNSKGRVVAAQTRPSAPAGDGSAGGGTDPNAGGAAGGGAMAMCANETLGEAMARAVEAGSTIALATGGFTGTVETVDGEIGVPYSEVELTVDEQLAGPELPATVSTWVFGDLGAAAAGTTQGATTEEGQSLWAGGGRMIAVIDPAAGGYDMPGPSLWAAPVVGDDVILSYIGCWTTQGVTVQPFDGPVQLFDNQGLHPTETELWALPLADFRAVLPS